MSIKKRQIIHKKIYSSIRGLGIIEELLEEPDITEIMINGPNNIFVEKKGRINKIDERFESENRLNDIIQQIVAKTNFLSQLKNKMSQIPLWIHDLKTVPELM